MSKIDTRIALLKAKLDALEIEKKEKDRAAKQAERQRVRKTENRRKFELGGLLKLADMFECDKGALLGMFLAIRPSLNDAVAFSEYKRSGDALLAQRESERKQKEPLLLADDSYLN